MPGTIYDLQYIFADPAEAAAICEYHRLSNEQAANQQGLVLHDIRKLEKAFPHLDFPTILRLLQEISHEILTMRPALLRRTMVHDPQLKYTHESSSTHEDHVSGAAAQNTGSKSNKSFHKRLQKKQKNGGLFFQNVTYKHSISKFHQRVVR